jgi:hypothetical protein
MQIPSCTNVQIHHDLPQFSARTRTIEPHSPFLPGRVVGGVRQGRLTGDCAIGVTRKLFDLLYALASTRRED